VQQFRVKLFPFDRWLFPEKRLERMVSLFSFFLLFFGKAGGGDCSKTNCKLRTNWLTQPKAAIKRADADAKGSAPSL